MTGLDDGREKRSCRDMIIQRLALPPFFGVVAPCAGEVSILVNAALEKIKIPEKTAKKRIVLSIFLCRLTCYNCFTDLSGLGFMEPW